MMNFSILLYVGENLWLVRSMTYEVFINLGQIWICRVKITTIMIVKSIPEK